MKKILIGAGLFVAGVILENKYGVQDKAKDLGKKAWKWSLEKMNALKEDVKENIDDLKEEVSE